MTTTHTQPDSNQLRREKAFRARTAQSDETPIESGEGISDAPRFAAVQVGQKRALRNKLGRILVTALEDPKTLDVMLNPDGKIFQLRLGKKPKKIGYMNYYQASALINYVAGCFNMVVNAENPILTCELPLWNGPRFEGQVPPLVAAPSFCIRKKSVLVYTLDDYVKQGVISREQRRYLGQSVRQKRNIVVIGGTGSGKTTFVNAIIHEMTLAEPLERQLILEDTGELQSVCENRVNLCTSFNTNMTKLVYTSLRMAPDRIIIGELRGPEAYDLLQAWNTGHPGGATTIHANNCHAGLYRLQDLVTSHEFAPDVPQNNILATINDLVHIQKDPECHPAGRRVDEIKKLVNWSSEGGYILEDAV